MHAHLFAVSRKGGNARSIDSQILANRSAEPRVQNDTARSAPLASLHRRTGTTHRTTPSGRGFAQHRQAIIGAGRKALGQFFECSKFVASAQAAPPAAPQVPHAKRQRHDAKPVSHPRILAMVDLPAAPEGHARRQQHEHSTNPVHALSPRIAFILPLPTLVPGPSILVPPSSTTLLNDGN